MFHKFLIRRILPVLLILAALDVASLLPCRAQQYTMKGGASIGRVTVPPRDAADKSGRMVNYFWEAEYAYRFKRYRFVTAGLAYLGAGCTFHYVYQPDGYIAPYNVKTRFSNLLVPIKFKFGTEHRAHPRYYGYAGTALGWMFDEDRETILESVSTIDGFTNPQLMSLFKKRNNIPSWTPKRFQNYLLFGGGVYYKHVILDGQFYVSTFKDYLEYLAPVSFNYGFILSIGYQVSRDTKKMW